MYIFMFSKCAHNLALKLKQLGCTKSALAAHVPSPKCSKVACWYYMPSQHIPSVLNFLPQIYIYHTVVSQGQARS